MNDVIYDLSIVYFLWQNVCLKAEYQSYADHKHACVLIHLLFTDRCCAFANSKHYHAWLV